MMNTPGYRHHTSVGGNEDCGINHNTISIVWTGLHFLTFVPAVILNVMVAWVILWLKTKSTFMLYLKNLVVVDLVMTLTMPVRAVSSLPDVALGLRVFDCRFASVLFYACLNISIILMGLISLDRFFKVVRPRGCLLGQSLLFGRVAIVATWVIEMVGVCLPTMILTGETPKENSTCMDMKSQEGLKFHEVVVWLSNTTFWIVLVLIAFCYACIARAVIHSYHRSRSTNTKGQRKTKAKVFVVLAVFLVCFSPYYIIRIPYTKLQVKGEHSCMLETLLVIKHFAVWLATTNICLDPLIYFFLCKSVREKLLDLGILRRLSSARSLPDDESTNM